jgi:hypothetical protein
MPAPPLLSSPSMPTPAILPSTPPPQAPSLPPPTGQGALLLCASAVGPIPQLTAAVVDLLVPFSCAAAVQSPAASTPCALPLPRHRSRNLDPPLSPSNPIPRFRRRLPNRISIASSVRRGRMAAVRGDRPMNLGCGLRRPLRMCPPGHPSGCPSFFSLIRFPSPTHRRQRALRVRAGSVRRQRTRFDISDPFPLRWCPPWTATPSHSGGVPRGHRRHPLASPVDAVVDHPHCPWTWPPSPASVV